MQDGEAGPTMVLRKVSTIIPLGNLTKRGTISKALETKSRISSEPGSLKDRDSWLAITGTDGFEECEVSPSGPRMDCSMSNVHGMSFLFGKVCFFRHGRWSNDDTCVIECLYVLCFERCQT